MKIRDAFEHVNPQALTSEAAEWLRNGDNSLLEAFFHGIRLSASPPVVVYSIGRDNPPAFTLSTDETLQLQFSAPRDPRLCTSAPSTACAVLCLMIDGTVPQIDYTQSQFTITHDYGYYGTCLNGEGQLCALFGRGNHHPPVLRFNLEEIDQEIEYIEADERHYSYLLQGDKGASWARGWETELEQLSVLEKTLRKGRNEILSQKAPQTASFYQPT